MRTEKWYQRRLAKHFSKYYGRFEDIAEFYPDPFVNQWAFDIPDLDVKVTITCNEHGDVNGKIYCKEGIIMSDVAYLDDIFTKVQDACKDMDAVYEDYLIDLVGLIGFQFLRANRLVEGCGSVNGRNLYALCAK